MPEVTEWAKEQNLHEPTRSYGEEIYEIVKDFKYENALEIGSAWGVSAMAILMAGQGKLTSVDVDINNHAISEVKANGLEQRFISHIQDSKDFWKQNRQTFDLIFVDGDHRYEGVRHDMFEAWKVLDNNGLIIFDDICHKSNRSVDLNGKFSEYGVSLAAWEFIKEHNITKIHTTTRLLYIFKFEQ